MKMCPKNVNCEKVTNINVSTQIFKSKMCPVKYCKSMVYELRHKVTSFFYYFTISKKERKREELYVYSTCKKNAEKSVTFVTLEFSWN